jgi:Xaa-Pro dipeptidase
VEKDSPELRISGFRSVLEKKKMAIAIVSDPLSVRYLTGFKTQNPGSASFLVVLISGESYLIVGESEREFVKSIPVEVLTFKDYDLNKRIVVNPESMTFILASSLKKIEMETRVVPKKIGIEAWHLPQVYLSALRKTFREIRVFSISADLLSMRETKGKDEIVFAQEASRRLDFAYSVAKTCCVPSQREIEIYSYLNQIFSNKYGYFAHATGGYASGERTLKMGGPPTSRKLQKGDTVILDLQTDVNGYYSDTCRTFFVGDFASSQRKTFETLLSAKNAAEDLLRPGIKCKEIYRAVTTELVKAGYKPLPHHAGHGVGLQIQEPPFLIPGSDEVLKEGMICALEPGIYSAKTGGMRIEDNYLIAKAGFKRLSRFPI